MKRSPLGQTLYPSVPRMILAIIVGLVKKARCL